MEDIESIQIVIDDNKESMTDAEYLLVMKSLQNLYNKRENRGYHCLNLCRFFVYGFVVGVMVVKIFV
jgi:tetrahydromethanopterin S-methyltransferase subunit B